MFSGWRSRIIRKEKNALVRKVCYTEASFLQLSVSRNRKYHYARNTWLTLNLFLVFTTHAKLQQAVPYFSELMQSQKP